MSATVINQSNSNNSNAQSQQPRQTDYQIRPSFNDLFKPRDVQNIIKQTMTEYFVDKEQYDSNDVGQWCKQLSVQLKNTLKQCNKPRYKYIVQCIIGEQKNIGIKISSKSLWDTQTDRFIQEVYQNNSLYCVTMAWAVYLY